jgi:(1->4)-alpha-D-glucan 1-alpha-D-glucosylmutase
MPGKADIAMLLQTIVGAWPFDLTLEDAVGRAAFASAWKAGSRRPCARPSSRPTGAIPTRLTRRRRATFSSAGRRGRSARAARRDLRLHPGDRAGGAINGLAQTLLRLTVPGVPDLYQGTELWDLSLVDPDNRRPVDFALRQRCWRRRRRRPGATARSSRR